jgi:hypothetical protein
MHKLKEWDGICHLEESTLPGKKAVFVRRMLFSSLCLSAHPFCRLFFSLLYLSPIMFVDASFQLHRILPEN